MWRHLALWSICKQKAYVYAFSEKSTQYWNRGVPNDYKKKPYKKSAVTHFLWGFMENTLRFDVMLSQLHPPVLPYWKDHCPSS